MEIKMSFSVVMDRPFKEGVHYVSPGGYELGFSDKFCDTVEFDFNHAEYVVDSKNPRVLHYEVRGWNFDWANCTKGTFAVMMEHGNAEAQFEYFSVYTSKHGDAEIHAVEIYDIKLDIDGQIYEFGDFHLD